MEFLSKEAAAEKGLQVSGCNGISYKPENTKRTLRSGSIIKQSPTEERAELLSCLTSEGSTENQLAIVAAPFFGSCRFFLMILCNLAIFLLILQRFNLSMAIVCMVHDENNESENLTTVTTNYSAESMADDEYISEHKFGEFDWDKDIQGHILGGFYYGYICTQILGGYISDKFGGKFSMLFGIGVLSLGSILSPLMARLDPMALMAVRVIQGAVSGFAYGATYNLFTKWSSPEERATIMSIVFSGIPIACILNYPMSSALCHSGIDGGWPMVFYVPGALGLVWCVVFQFSAYSSPSLHPRISNKEKDYLLKSNKQEGDKQSFVVPWKSIFTSKAVLALGFTFGCAGWGYNLLALSLPTFTKEVLKLNVMNAGLTSALPYVGMLLFKLSGKTFDFMRIREYTSLTNLRKIYNTIGFITPCICMFSLYFVPSEDATAHMALFTISQSVQELALCGGFYLSGQDIAGPFAGILFGFTNTIAQIPGFVNPILVAYFTPNGTREEWLIIFYICGAVNFLGALIYLIFGSAETEPWAQKRENATDTTHGPIESGA